MYISITLDLGEKTYDIQVDDRQTIKSVLEVLKEADLYGGDTNINFYKSGMKNDLVSGYRTLNEENILKGDKLIAVLQ